MRLDDQRLRSFERALAANPGDAEAALQLSLDYQRFGREADAAEVAVNAWRRSREHGGLTERVAQLGLEHGPWPYPNGLCNRRHGLLPGPDEGVVRWRVRLPRQSVGAPLVDTQGRVLLRALPAGLMRVAPNGREVELISSDWSPRIMPILRGDRPTVFDPVLCELSQPELTQPFVEGGAWHAVIGEDGRVYGLGPDRTIAIDAEGDQLWTLWDLSVHELVGGSSGPVHAGVPLGPSGPRILAVDRETGDPIRERSAGPAGDEQRLAISLAPDGSLVSCLGTMLTCTPPGGEPRWQLRLRLATPPAVSEEAVVVSNFLRGTLAFDLRSNLPSAVVRWQRPELKTVLPPVLDARDQTYLLGMEGWVAGIRADGEVFFRVQLNGLAPRGTAAIGYDRTLYLGAGDELVAVR